MEGLLSRVFGLMLCFLLLIVAPLINAYGTQEMENRVELLNDVSSFLDKQTDKGGITQSDIDQFYVKAESHGMALNVTVRRYVKMSTKMKNGEIHTSYVAADDTSILNQHDILQVNIKEISSTPYKRLLSLFLKIYDKPYTLTMAKMVK